MRHIDHRDQAGSDVMNHITNPCSKMDTSAGPGYYLAGWFTAEPEAPGTVVDAGPMPYLESPRGCDPEETVLCPPLEDTTYCPMTDWLNNPENTTVYRVEPVAVAPARQVGKRCDAQRWTVLGSLPPEALLGPQAATLYTVHRDLYRLFFARPRDDERRALLKQYEPQEHEQALEHEHRISAAHDAAVAALSRVGSISRRYLGHCQLDGELVAVAAFDLIDTVEGWDRAAYDLIMGRYVRTFGDPIG